MKHDPSEAFKSAWRAAAPAPPHGSIWPFALLGIIALALWWAIELV